MGDWKGHLRDIKQFIILTRRDIFHMSNLRTCTYKICNLQELMNGPKVYEKCTEEFSTIRRSNKFNCGTSTNIIIEQIDDEIFENRTETLLEVEVHKRVSNVDGFTEYMTMDTTDQHVDAID